MALNWNASKLGLGIGAALLGPPVALGLGVTAGLGYLGLRAAPSLLKVGAVTAAAGISAIGMTGAAMATTAIGAGWALGRGRAPITAHPHELGGLKWQGYTLNRATQNTLGFGALGVAAGSAAYNATADRSWRLSPSVATGQMEVEKPNFMGATGSLTLASSRSRNRRVQDGASGMNPDVRQALMHTALNSVDDVAMGLARAF